MRHESTIMIGAPAELVWRTIRTVEKWPEWTPTMTEVRRLDDGELRVGSTAEVGQPNQPKRTWTVTELAPDHSFTWTARSPGVRLAAGHAVAPVAALLAGRTIRRLVDLEASSLKKWCETRG